MNSSQKTLSLTEAVTGLLKQSELPATLTIEQSALALAMSMTSFRRKLTLEETTFKLIQNKYLNELCVHALLTDHVNIDDLVVTLGYSERATFERAFRNKFGITPSKFRELSLIGNDKNNPNNLADIAQNMPPLSDSCQALLLEKNSASLDIERVTEIVANDPIFSGRVMGLASKAVYGKTPNNIHEAISRNLGINTVVNLAVIYSVKDALQEQVSQELIDQYTDAFLMAPKFFQLIRKSVGRSVKFDNDITEQVLVFALLGVFLLSHKAAYQHELMVHSLQGIEDLHSLNRHINEAMDISLYSASSLMLSLWHIDASLVKEITHLNKLSLRGSQRTKQDELVLFMLSCLYRLATGYKDYSDLESKAELLNITDFEEIQDLLLA